VQHRQIYSSVIDATTIADLNYARSNLLELAGIDYVLLPRR
jgi:hypothetical protein